MLSHSSAVKTHVKQQVDLSCRADVVPRLSAASVEGAFLELAAASPVRTAAAKFGRQVTSTLEGLKVSCPLNPLSHHLQRVANISRILLKYAAALQCFLSDLDQREGYGTPAHHLAAVEMCWGAATLSLS